MLDTFCLYEVWVYVFSTAEVAIDHLLLLLGSIGRNLRLDLSIPLRQDWRPLDSTTDTGEVHIVRTYLMLVFQTAFAD